MQCSQCQFENRETAKFCEECGTKLVRVCPSCAYEVGPSAKFCPECGTSLIEPGLPSSSPQIQIEANKPTPDSSPLAAEREGPVGERRQLTVMFCDLVGSTPLAEKLDPEELREVLRAYQEGCARVITRFEGYLARYIGDGILVYFGYPVAHEDDAQRAVRAGLDMVGELPQLNTRVRYISEVLHDMPLQVRIGIHTGLVVVGDMGGGGFRDPMAIVGETPNIAARVQGKAEPDTVVISGATYRLVQGLFACHGLGPQSLKGVSALVETYQVLGESETPSRFEVAVSTGLTPLVGREQEMGLLVERWERVQDGEGQVVMLSGEAGIGKSRLLQELKERLITEPYMRLECRCSPYYQNSALYPIIGLLHQVLQFKEGESSEKRLSKLESALGQYGFLLAEVVPLFASLLSVPLDDRYAPLTLTPQKQKEKMLEASLSWLLKEATRQPVCFVVEDLHWADPYYAGVFKLACEPGPHGPAVRSADLAPGF